MNSEKGKIEHKEEEFFSKQYFENITTPVYLPSGYKLLNFKDNKIIYLNTKGKEIDSDPYMHSTEDVLIVDEFRKKFPHDSAIILLFDNNGNMFLQRRGLKMRWEPGKIDLASVVGQRRVKLAGDHFERMDMQELAFYILKKETGIKDEEIEEQKLLELGSHFNKNTNEYQTVYGYKINLSLEDLNDRLKFLEDQGEEWFRQDYKMTMDEYGGEGVEKYAGGADLRPINFISDSSIKENLERYIKYDG